MTTAVQTRTCLWCGVTIDHMRANATYCSMQHKKNAASARHRGRNPGYFKKYVGSPRYQAWLEGTREERAARARERRRTNGPTPRALAANAAWRAANKEQLRLNQRNYMSRKYDNPGYVVITQRDWAKLCRRYGNRCAYCGTKPDAALHMDHVVPLARGGRHGIGNILPACATCNTSKHSLLLIEWRIRDRLAAVGAPPGKGH